MAKRYVVDTMSIISYFSDVFGPQYSRISSRGLAILDRAFSSSDDVLLSIPGVVFVEIYDKWFGGAKAQSEEFRAMVRAELLERIHQSPNIEIREVDIETLEVFMTLEDQNINLENRDRLILAMAAALNAPLITDDPKLRSFAKKHRVIPYVIS